MTAFRDVWYDAPDGLRLYARDYPTPDGVDDNACPPLFCMPGLTRNSRDFAPFAADWSRTRRVIATDQRGRGLSDRDPDPDNYHPGTYARDMVALLDHLDLARVVLVGTSLGGLMATIICATVPNRVAGVVINDVGPELDQSGLARIRGYVGTGAPVTNWAEAEAETRRLNAHAFPDYSDAEWAAFTRVLYRENAEGVPVLDYDPAIARAFATSAAPPDLWPLFEGLARFPTLAIRGALSDLLSAETFAAMAARIPGLRQVEVPNRGHAPDLTEPAARAAISDLLRHLDRLPMTRDDPA